MNFNSFLSTVGSSKGGASLPASAIKFFEAMAEAKRRISYGGASALFGHILGWSPKRCTTTIASIPTVGELPRHLQCLVSRTNGSYDPKAQAKWGDVAPQGYQSSLPVIQDDLVTSAYEAFLEESRKPTQPPTPPIQPTE